MPWRTVLPPRLWDVRYPLRFELPQVIGQFRDGEFFESELLSQRHLRCRNFHVQGVVVEVAVFVCTVCCTCADRKVRTAGFQSFFLLDALIRVP